MSVSLPDFTKNYSIVDFLAELETFLKANLNSFITQNNTDRGTPSLLTIDSAAYFFQTLNETVVNFDPFVFYGESEVVTDSIGPATERAFSIDIGICKTVGNNDPYDIITQLFRYREVLEVLFERGWICVNNRVKLEINSLSPFPIANANSSEPTLGIGITLLVHLN